jgi:hypothetical protein
MNVWFILHKNEGKKEPAFPSVGIGLDRNENWYFVGNVVIVFQKFFPGLRVVNRLQDPRWGR